MVYVSRFNMIRRVLKIMNAVDMCVQEKELCSCYSIGPAKCIIMYSPTEKVKVA